MNDTIKIISEDDKSYMAEVDGKVVKLFKIDKNEIDERWKNTIYHISKHIPKHNFEELLKVLIEYINHIPNVNEYKRVANRVTCYIDKLYKIISPICNQHISNVFHHPYKNINIEIYGKAYTFMKEIKSLLNTMDDIGKQMVENGELKEFKIIKPFIPMDYSTAISSIIGYGYKIA